MKKEIHLKQLSGLLRTAKRTVALLAFCMAIFITKANAQDTAGKSRLTELLQSYYTIKDALVSGNSIAAATGANAFVKNLNGVSYEVISEGNISALAKDAGAIADTKDINAQRKYFAGFSANMLEVAKTRKLSDKPVYIQYCPMKKASWLSSDKEIKNPYYGSAMLGCGSVTGTLE